MRGALATVGTGVVVLCAVAVALPLLETHLASGRLRERRRQSADDAQRLARVLLRRVLDTAELAELARTQLRGHFHSAFRDDGRTLVEHAADGGSSSGASVAGNSHDGVTGIRLTIPQREASEQEVGGGDPPRLRRMGWTSAGLDRPARARVAVARSPDGRLLVLTLSDEARSSP